MLWRDADLQALDGKGMSLLTDRLCVPSDQPRLMHFSQKRPPIYD